MAVAAGVHGMAMEEVCIIKGLQMELQEDTGTVPNMAIAIITTADIQDTKVL